MTYSRQQRERAVDLCIKYEHSAADVIHELGYPSRTILYVWHRDRLEEERTGVPSGRGQRHRRYSDEQKQAAVDHCLEYGRRPGRTMRMPGYPKSKEPLMAWIDELAPGQRKLRHGPVPEEPKREAAVAVASGRMKSRETADGLGVQAAVVRNRKRQMLARSREEPVSETERGKAVARAGNPAGARPAVPNSSDAAGLADALASMQRKVAELQARLDALDADVERQRREKRELDVEIAIRRGTLELLGKGPGADPENLTSREKAILVKQTGERLGVTAKSLFDAVGIPHSTYHLPARRHERARQGRVAAALGRGGVREQREALRVQARPSGTEGHGDNGVGQTGHEAHGQAWHGAVAQEREAVRLVQGRAGQGASRPREPRFPRREAEHAVGHGFDGVLHPGGQGVPVSHHRLPRRASGRLDDRHEPQRRAGQRHAFGRVLRARRGRETGHPQ